MTRIKGRNQVETEEEVDGWGLDQSNVFFRFDVLGLLLLLPRSFLLEWKHIYYEVASDLCALDTFKEELNHMKN